MLIEGIIVLIIGVILFAIQSLIPPEARKLAYIAGLILVVIGIILIVIGALGIPFLTGGTYLTNIPPPLATG